jgi:hypothetical protein
VATVAIALLIAYAVAFVLPGIILALSLSTTRSRCTQRCTANRVVWHGVVLATVASGILIGEYILFVSPNDPSVLRAQWRFVASVEPSSIDKSVGKDSSFLTASESYQFLEELPIPRPTNKGENV